MKPGLFRTTVCVAAFLSIGGFAHAAAPANDDLADAQVIPSGSSFSVVGTEVNATQEAFEKAAAYPYSDLTATVWYSWTPSVSGMVKLSAPGGPFGTATLLYKGPGTPTAVTLVTGNSPGVLTPPLAPVTAGQQYFICIGNDGDYHSFTLTGTILSATTPTPPPTPTPTPGSAPTATVVVKTPKIDRATGEAGKLVFTLSSAPASAVTLNYKVSGTAVAGTDYKMLPGSVTVSAGADDGHRQAQAPPRHRRQQHGRGQGQAAERRRLHAWNRFLGQDQDRRWQLTWKNILSRSLPSCLPGRAGRPAALGRRMDACPRFFAAAERQSRERAGDPDRHLVLGQWH